MERGSWPPSQNPKLVAIFLLQPHIMGRLQVAFPDTLTLFITVRLLAIAGVPAHRSLAEPHDALVTLAYTRQAYVPCVTLSCQS